MRRQQDGTNPHRRKLEMAKLRESKREQHGFTLIEIIAVLVILGILAVVAVPKYLDLQTEARNSATQGLIAAAQSQLSMGYAANRMNSQVSTDPSKECAKVKVSAGGATAGTVTCKETDWKADVTITATVPNGTPTTATWSNPGI